MESLICVVCGRSFHQGQGVTMELSGKSLEFHSKDCAYKFLRELMQQVDSDCVSGPVKRLLDNYEERRQEAAKQKQKKI